MMLTNTIRAYIIMISILLCLLAIISLITILPIKKLAVKYIKEHDIPKKNDKLKIILFYIFLTIIYFIIFNLLQSLLWKNYTIGEQYSCGVLSCRKLYANPIYSAISILGTLINFIIYFILSMKTIYQLFKWNDKIIKYIIIIIFELLMIISSLLALIYMSLGGELLGDHLILNSIFLNIIHILTIIIPPFILLISTCIKFITMKNREGLGK